jgi:hypothetical protein
MTSIMTYSCMKKVSLFSLLLFVGSGSGIKDGRIRDPGYQKIVGSGSRIRDKHPGSATLFIINLFSVEMCWEYIEIHLQYGTVYPYVKSCGSATLLKACRYMPVWCPYRYFLIIWIFHFLRETQRLRVGWYRYSAGTFYMAGNKYLWHWKDTVYSWYRYSCQLKCTGTGNSPLVVI